MTKKDPITKEVRRAKRNLPWDFSVRPNHWAYLTKLKGNKFFIPVEQYGGYSELWFSDFYLRKMYYQIQRLKKKTMPGYLMFGRIK